MTKINKIHNCRYCENHRQVMQVGEYQNRSSAKYKHYCVYEYGYSSHRDMEVSCKELDITKGIPVWCEKEEYTCVKKEFWEQ